MTTGVGLMEDYCEQTESRLSDECGCPEQEFIYGMVNVTIHIEPDGTGHAFFDTGDWDQEIRFNDVSDIDDLRSKAVAWVDKLPREA